MAETVYVFGAGINQSLCNAQGNRPPLATDLFQKALARPIPGYAGEPSWYSPVFDFIQRFWKLSVDDLKHQPFDLEECYTLLELQANEAHRRGNLTEALRLFDVKSRLTLFFSKYLGHSSFSAHNRSVDFMTLGKVLWKEKATVITFNYDDLVESAIQSAAGPSFKADVRWPEYSEAKQRRKSGERLDWPSWDKFNDIPDEVMTYSRYAWDPLRAYGVKFDEVVHRAWDVRGILVNGDAYFEHNGPCQPTVLKMHGSLNWGRYVRHVHQRGRSSTPPRAIDPGTTIISSRCPIMIADHLIEPLIITPMLFKDLNEHSIVVQIWQRALKELKACERLIVGGYSFPPTDFYARKLFLEAFADRQPREVIVINRDPNMEPVVQGLTHVSPRRFENLDSFIQQYGDHHTLIDEWDERWVRSIRKGREK